MVRENMTERYRIGYVLTKHIAVFDLFREYARQGFANQVFKLVLYNEFIYLVARAE